MKLMMDGKQIGQMDTQSGEIRDDSGAPVKGAKVEEPPPETMDVPLHPTLPRNRVRAREEEPPPDEEEENTEEEDEEQVDDKLLEHPLIAQLLKGQTKLQQQLAQLARVQNHRMPEEQLDFIDESYLNPEKDPVGIARTLKALIKKVGGISALEEKVGRVDQHLGYKEATSLLEQEKSHHPIYKDKQLGKLADRLLKAELQSNQEDDMSTIVRSVAREVLRAHPERAVRAKAEQKAKLPPAGGTRRSEGVTPSVTVNKPKSLAEAREAYHAWKGARAKAMNRG